MQVNCALAVFVVCTLPVRFGHASVHVFLDFHDSLHNNFSMKATQLLINTYYGIKCEIIGVKPLWTYFRLDKIATLCSDCCFAHSWRSLNELHEVATRLCNSTSDRLPRDAENKTRWNQRSPIWNHQIRADFHWSDVQCLCWDCWTLVWGAVNWGDPHVSLFRCSTLWFLQLDLGIGVCCLRFSRLAVIQEWKGATLRNLEI